MLKASHNELPIGKHINHNLPTVLGIKRQTLTELPTHMQAHKKEGKNLRSAVVTKLATRTIAPAIDFSIF